MGDKITWWTDGGVWARGVNGGVILLRLRTPIDTRKLSSESNTKRLVRFSAIIALKALPVYLVLDAEKLKGYEENHSSKKLHKRPQD